MASKRGDSDEAPVTQGGAASGWVMVAVQGALLVGIALWPGAIGGRFGSARPLGFVLIALAAVGVGAAAASLGRALSPHPDPNGAGLQVGGVYRWVRHPMYTAVLLGAAGIACLRGVVVAWVLTVALVGLFEIKSRREEARLVVTYPGYAEYASRTGKFLPWIGRRAI